MLEKISGMMPFITLGTVVIGGLALGVYHILTFNASKKKHEAAIAASPNSFGLIRQTSS